MRDVIKRALAGQHLAFAMVAIGFSIFFVHNPKLAGLDFELAFSQPAIKRRSVTFQRRNCDVGFTPALLIRFRHRSKKSLRSQAGRLNIKDMAGPKDPAHLKDQLSRVQKLKDALVVASKNQERRWHAKVIDNRIRLVFKKRDL